MNTINIKLRTVIKDRVCYSHMIDLEELLYRHEY